MTAAAENPFNSSPVPELPPDTTPAAIRDALIDEERGQFERAYREALAEASDTLDLTRVLEVLRTYHRIAWMTQRQGRDAHRRMLDKVDEISRTGVNPTARSPEDMTALINKRLGR
jgi:hypothetical protein